MELLENLYVADNVTDLPRTVYALRRKIPLFRVYCVVWMEKRNRIEILSSSQLFVKRNMDLRGVIMGVAMGKHAAEVLLTTIVETVSKNGKNLSEPREWLEA